MVVVNGQGQSQATPIKQGIFEAVLDQHLSIVSAIRMTKYLQRGWRFPGYVYIDATAGCGDNLEVGVPGSPRIFDGKIRDSGMPYKSYLIDRDSKNVERLQSLFKDDPRVNIYCGKHEFVMSEVLTDIGNNKPFGILYFDPNGAPNFEFIAHLCRAPMLERVDLLIRFSATAVKRVRRAFGRDSLEEMIREIPKTNWMVGYGAYRDPWQSAFLFGLNTPIKEYRKTGLHNIDSATGQQILYQINYTSEEKQAFFPPQTCLFDFWRSKA